MNRAAAIDIVLDEFDFDRVVRVMKSLRWKWASINAVPTRAQLIECARDLLEQVEDGDIVATGGLEATYVDGWLELRFVVESASFNT